MPEPSRLDITLARLKAMVGEDRVGAPALEDTHRGGSFRMENFAVGALLPTLAPKNSARMGHPVRQGMRIARGVRRSPSPSSSPPEAAPARMALRRVRPATSVWVVQNAMKPIAFRDAENRFEVAAAYGPWRSSGCWWSGESWDDEEWDVLATAQNGASVACLLVRDRLRNTWRLEAFYD
jgi:protein ImuB